MKFDIKELQSDWMDKYNFSIRDHDNEKWRLFFKELKTHMKNEQIEVVFTGLNIILRYNPFFLKKYKRYYLFEELAYSYEEQGNIKKAIRCLKLQARLIPESTEPYLNMSSFYIINGMEDDAIRTCEEGLEKNPNDSFLISNLIIALCNIENHSFALSFLKISIKKNKNNNLLWKLMGDVNYELQDNKEAIKCYNKALSIKAENIEQMLHLYMELCSGIAACYFEEEEYAKAIKYHKKVLTYDKNDAYTLLSLSQIYVYYLKDMDKAYKYTKLLLNQTPDSGFGQLQLGLIYFHKGNMEKSRWYLYSARRMMPGYAPVIDAIEMLKNNPLTLTTYN